jgi:hypothetical protein
MSDKRTSASYLVSLKIDYPEKDLNRLTSVFRLFLIVPIVMILVLVSGPSWDSAKDAWRFPVCHRRDRVPSHRADASLPMEVSALSGVEWTYLHYQRITGGISWTPIDDRGL